jgi:2,4-dienoyl-CoA reductase (NADPH2)
LNVNVQLNKEISAEELKQIKVDVIILATGASPIIPSIDGIHNFKVLNCMEALASPEKIGKEVAVIGGG